MKASNKPIVIKVVGEPAFASVEVVDQAAYPSLFLLSLIMAANRTGSLRSESEFLAASNFMKRPNSGVANTTHTSKLQGFHTEPLSFSSSSFINEGRLGRGGRSAVQRGRKGG
jgi:hypothetical protein